MTGDLELVRIRRGEYAVHVDDATRPRVAVITNTLGAWLMVHDISGCVVNGLYGTLGHAYDTVKARHKELGAKCNTDS